MQPGKTENIITVKMYPLKNKIDNIEKITPLLKPTTCLCKTLSPVFTLCRYSGMLPISWEHRDDKCYYKRSNIWMAYNILIIALCIFQLVNSIDFEHFASVKCLTVMMNDITSAIYGVYIIALLSICFWRASTWVDTLNKLQKTLKHNIFCNSSMTQCMLVQRAILITILVIFSMCGSTMLYLHYSDSASNFNYKNIINYFLLHLSFIFYGMFVSMIAVFLGILACFEKLTISCLNYKPVHPMKGIDETNNKGDIWGLITYELCKGTHGRTEYINKLPAAEVIEFLRILHEEISIVMYDVNRCINPQFLVHTVVELTVLIVHWYSIIVYMAYDFKDPRAGMIHVMNCIFCFPHTIGLFFFLRHTQQLKNMVHSLTSFLLEYSTRISSVEEHQQVRMFIEKIKQHRPFTASGVFNIDLGIAGPISANILTYVLVALQFDIPKE